ncbi:hypothetical protein HKX48_002298, partial [Thoreauomyces humboldtii]
ASVFSLTIIAVAAAIASPYLMSELILLLNPNADHAGLMFDNIWTYCALYLGAQLLFTVCYYSKENLLLQYRTRSRAVLVGRIFEKALRLSGTSRQAFPAAKINTLIATDVPKTYDIVGGISETISNFAQIALALYFLSTLLGSSIAIVSGVFVFCSLLQFTIMPRLQQGMGTYMELLDLRTKRLREFLYGVRAIKLEVLEDVFYDLIQDARRKQLAGLRKFLSAMVGLVVCGMTQQIGLPLITVILLYVTSDGHHLKASIVFPVLGYLGALMSPSARIASDFSHIMQFRIAYKRLSAFLIADEQETSVRAGQYIGRSAERDVDGDAIVIRDASFRWDTTAPGKDRQDAPTPSHHVPSEGAFQLHDLTVSIPRGRLTLVVGPTASGKSSLLTAITGGVGMTRTKGSVTVPSTLAYCDQRPFLLTGTIRDNILGPFETARSTDPEAAARMCGLERDIDVLPWGLGTRVGEKGIALSGGQQARVALARAVASEAECVLVDDTLAALDARIGAKVFRDAICAMAKDAGRTVVMATSQP